MNRQTKRMMAKQGSDQPRKPDARRQPASSAPKREKIGPRAYLSEVRGELKKVEWPDQKAVISGTVVVIVACVIVGTYLWLNDRLWSYVVQHVLLR